MEEINNYKLSEFLQQDEELIEQYSKLLKHLEPIPTKHKVHELTLRQVETIKQTVNSPDTLPEVFGYVQDITEKEFNEMKITEFYGLYNDLMKQLENLVGMEEQELTSEHSDFKWEAVDGGKRLGVLGILPTVDTLAGGDVLRYEQVLDLPYMTCFNKLRMERIRGDIERDMNKVKTLKHD